MEIEYVEESRLQVWSIRVNSQFAGILVLKTESPYKPIYEIHQWTGTGFILWNTISGFIPPERYNGLRLEIKEMMS